MSTLLLAPSPGTIIAAPSGNQYTPDANGWITVPATNNDDIRFLIWNGFFVVPAVQVSMCIATLLGANCNITTAQPLIMHQPLFAKYHVTKVIYKNASATLSSTSGSIYNAATSGTALYTAAAIPLTAVNTSVDVSTTTSGTPGPTQAAGTALFLILGTAEGSAATCDIYVMGDVYVNG